MKTLLFYIIAIVAAIIILPWYMPLLLGAGFVGGAIAGPALARKHSKAVGSSYRQQLR